jgi:hypothetical protein
MVMYMCVRGIDFASDLNILYCQICTKGLNTSFTTYMKFSPFASVSTIFRLDSGIILTMYYICVFFIFTLHSIGRITLYFE